MYVHVVSPDLILRMYNRRRSESGVWKTLEVCGGHERCVEDTNLIRVWKTLMVYPTCVEDMYKNRFVSNDS